MRHEGAGGTREDETSKIMIKMFSLELRDHLCLTIACSVSSKRLPGGGPYLSDRHTRDAAAGIAENHLSDYPNNNHD